MSTTMRKLGPVTAIGNLFTMSHVPACKAQSLCTTRDIMQLSTNLKSHLTQAQVQ
jgi:hypothetical protein